MSDMSSCAACVLAWIGIPGIGNRPIGGSRTSSIGSTASVAAANCTHRRHILSEHCLIRHHLPDQVCSAVLPSWLLRRAGERRCAGAPGPRPGLASFPTLLDVQVDLAGCHAALHSLSARGRLSYHMATRHAWAEPDPLAMCARSWPGY